ncbi:hypothetical protein [Streptomyces flavalbus]|uniref:Uncharacterized protein n=1 Tax=Streptomyces flavalbus TaxID=2665155 RepID=A0ABW2WDT1_9ACTN
MTDLVEALSRAILETGEELMREHGACLRPQVHILAEDMDQPYVGFITCRPFYRGADAATALTGLGLFPSVLMATRLLVAWDDRDLRTGLEMPGEPYDRGLVILDATFEDHTLHWHPYDYEVLGDTDYGTTRIKPLWNPPAHYRDVPLLPPISDLLALWKEFRRDDIQETAIELQRAGYEFDMVSR